jgi:putative hydrolase
MGFGPSDPDDDDEQRPGGDSGNPFDPVGNPFGDGSDPLAQMMGQLMGPGGADELAKALSAAGVGPIDPSQLTAMIGQVQRMLATPGDGSPVNWQIATDIARQAVSAHGDSSIGMSQQRAVADALRLADMWLEDRTTLPTGATRTVAWSRAEWVEGTLPVWKQLVEPVATSVSSAMAAAMARQAPPELAAMMGSAESMMRQVGGSVFGMQLGQAMGALATEVVSGTEVGLPLVADGTVVLLPANVEAFGEGLDVPADEVRLYLALREAARARLFTHVPWLGPYLLGAVEAYATGIVIDTERIEEAVRGADPSDPASIQQALSEGLFEPVNTPAQTAALGRLETALALVEGWVEIVVASASGQLPHADALRETVRRKRRPAGQLSRRSPLWWGWSCGRGGCATRRRCGR